jgi:hypothetical protein
MLLCSAFTQNDVTSVLDEYVAQKVFNVKGLVILARKGGVCNLVANYKDVKRYTLFDVIQ